MHQHKLFWIICLFLLSACQSDPNPNNSTPTLQNVAPSGPQFHLLSPQQSGLQFTNTVKESKEFHHLLWESVYYGGGVAVGDLNNDGLPDLYFTGNQVNDALYLNQGKLKFKDISQKAGIDQKAGWSTGVTMVDINADGWLDIYVCRSWWDLDNNNVDGRRNLLWINNHDLTFTEKAAEYGLDDPAYSTQATFLDYDQDGDLDMYLMNAPSNNFQQKLKYQQQNKIPYALSDHFYENMGKNKFRDRTKKVGIENYAFGLGLMASDINQDGWTDIYVACDYEKPDLLFLNNRDGSFRNQSGATLKHTSYSSMGCDLADFNNDCLLEIAVLDMQAADHKRAKMNMRAMNAKTFWKNVDQGYGFQYMSNALQLNNGWGFFSEIGQMAGLASTDWSWSLLMNDFDNDGHKDVFITNG
ncbi:MAG: VCBS repeat-containing protein, partial [Bacteroidota bacterium]